MSDSSKSSRYDLGKFWTIANVLSMARLVIVLPITWLILTDGSLLWIMLLVLLAIATDYFDGRVARWSDTVSDWGKVLDPVADKVGGGLVVAALTLHGDLPYWFLIVIISRDLSILVGGEIIRHRTGRIVMSMFSGKVAVTGVSITVLAALLRADPPVLQFCLWVTTGLLTYSFLRYLVRFFHMVRYPPVPGAEPDASSTPAGPGTSSIPGEPGASNTPGSEPS